MTKEELEKEAEEWVISNTEIYDDKFGIEREEEPKAKEAYLASAESREKRIAELKAQIKKMQNCRNCKNEKIEGACGHFTQVGWCRDWELAE